MDLLGFRSRQRRSHGVRRHPSAGARAAGGVPTAAAAYLAAAAPGRVAALRRWGVDSARRTSGPLGSAQPAIQEQHVNAEQIVGFVIGVDIHPGLQNVRLRWRGGWRCGTAGISRATSVGRRGDFGGIRFGRLIPRRERW